jgi:hypothetical protein
MVNIGQNPVIAKKPRTDGMCEWCKNFQPSHILDAAKALNRVLEPGKVAPEHARKIQILFSDKEKHIVHCPSCGRQWFVKVADVEPPTTPSV